MYNTARRLLAIAARNATHAKRQATCAEKRQDSAAVSVIMSAAAIECAIQTWMFAPVLMVSPLRLQKYVAELVTMYVRAPIHSRLKFLMSIDPRLKLPKKNQKTIQGLFARRNQLVHSSLAYGELHYLPDDWARWEDFVVMEHLPKRGSLTYKAWDEDLVELAQDCVPVARQFVEKLESVPLLGNEEKDP